jgi:colanic acid biosynthesis protein WcaH
MSTILDVDTFRTVVASAPLVSIDLIVRRLDGCVLLGQRVNRPALGFWFVPGGRIRKNETLDQAFLRLTDEELGACYSRTSAKLLGIYEHFYTDSVFGDCDDDPATHYVVISYELILVDDLVSLPLQQHTGYRWLHSRDILNAADVHANTKAYFLND